MVVDALAGEVAALDGVTGEVEIGGATVVVAGGTVQLLPIPQTGTPGGHPSVVMPHSVWPQLSVPHAGPGTQLYPGGISWTGDS
ncbi:hypothetical protein C8K38_11071 [Rhodococcus sp. OK611]|nr:hypothetical protein C8K38_11071 [Rhodococcus sp. OK611]SNX91869.1 hypothetical protein SAMN05447004_111156 [Rhodococcus sp. OK270]